MLVEASTSGDRNRPLVRRIDEQRRRRDLIIQSEKRQHQLQRTSGDSHPTVLREDAVADVHLAAGQPGAFGVVVDPTNDLSARIQHHGCRLWARRAPADEAMKVIITPLNDRDPVAL